MNISYRIASLILNNYVRNNNLILCVKILDSLMPNRALCNLVGKQNSDTQKKKKKESIKCNTEEEWPDSSFLY